MIHFTDHSPSLAHDRRVARFRQYRRARLGVALLYQYSGQCSFVCIKKCQRWWVIRSVARPTIVESPWIPVVSYPSAKVRTLLPPHFQSIRYDDGWECFSYESHVALSVPPPSRGNRINTLAFVKLFPRVVTLHKYDIIVCLLQRMKAVRCPTDELTLSNCAIINGDDFPDDVRWKYLAGIALFCWIQLCRLSCHVSRPGSISVYMSLMQIYLLLLIFYSGIKWK